MRITLAIVAVLLLATCHRASTPPAPSTRSAALIITSDLWGYLAPCGCSRDMRGGIDRAAAYVAQARKQGPTLLVDAGDALFERTELPPAERIQAQKKAATVLQALEQMGLAAKAVFTRDQVIPEVLKALPEKQRLAGPTVREVSGVRVGLLAVDTASEDPGKALAGGAEFLRRQKVDLVLALVHGPRAEVLSLGPAAQEAGVDGMVGSGAATIEEGDRARAAVVGTPVFFPQARGQSLLRIDVTLRDGTRPTFAPGEDARDRDLAALDDRIRSLSDRIAHLPAGTDPSPFQAKVEELRARRRALADEKPAPPARGSFFTARFVPLTEDRPSDPGVAALVQAYDRAAAEANLAFAREHGGTCPRAAPGEPAYAGEAACARCHLPAHAFWKGTGHAEAYATLQKASKQYDLSCIACHVTGWEKPGGACRIDQVAGRQDVTCESCHGPGSLHALAPVRFKLPRAVPETACRVCHTPENSTAFDYRIYLPRIVGPGHGQPVAKSP